MAKEVIAKAEQIKKRRKLEKVSALLLLLILIVLTFAYFVLNFVYNEGNFTINMDKNTYLRSNLVMYESMNDRSSVVKLSATKIPFMDNISIKWLPENINKAEGGNHNGENYIAYTFYLENKGDENIDYWYSVISDDVIKNVDEAVRVMIYVNDEKKLYAKVNSITKKAEPDTIAFKNEKDGTIILEERSKMKPGEIDKLTVVIWLEGDDPECVNSILGGEMKMHMNIVEEQVEEKNK